MKRRRGAPEGKKGGTGSAPGERKEKMAIYCDQTGYLPQSVKKAVMTAGKTYDVIRVQGASEQTVLSGSTQDAGTDKASGDHLYLADFSEICQEGVYYIQNEEGEKSHRFRIGQDVYRALQAEGSNSHSSLLLRWLRDVFSL